MKLSSKGRYAVRAIFHIAFYADGGATQVRDIAERQGIPPRFLEQIFQDLKRASLVVSKRGPQGGYSLARPATEITMGDIIGALEGPVQLSEPSGAEAFSGARDCLLATNSILEELSANMQSCLDEVTVGDICLRARKMGVIGPNQVRSNYVI